MISNTIKKIEDAAFEGCSNLKVLNLNALNLEGSDHFEDTKLNNVTIGKDVEQLGSRPFYRCYTIKEIRYLGIIDEWNNINETNLKSGNNITKVICTDGEVEL